MTAALTVRLRAGVPAGLFTTSTRSVIADLLSIRSGAPPPRDRCCSRPITAGTPRCRGVAPPARGGRGSKASTSSAPRWVRQSTGGSVPGGVLRHDVPDEQLEVVEDGVQARLRLLGRRPAWRFPPRPRGWRSPRSSSRRRAARTGWAGRRPNRRGRGVPAASATRSWCRRRPPSVTNSGNSASENEVSHSSPWMNGVSNGPPWSLSRMCSLMVNHQLTLIRSIGTWYFLPNWCMATGIT